ncbi:helix-turn-helix transcriptional regulator [Parabacteroides sp. PF5-6]|uniref:helix-turn-helix transcriptional regulator n=1 Tax=Parabacteroides sp. PF5-6 TaxID=1742403 RepID=UPI002406393F|nr:helix-turn-helix transcriptional regulator [Parabacteroides sp. PF5-6]MDF9830675.1 AraC-like DNA-binding protein [Parabacteroides sp. PF5-6]
MDLLYRSEHMACRHYDRTDKPVIEVVKIVKGEKRILSVNNNEIVFIIEGRLRYFFKEFPTHEAVKGQIIFRPAGADYAYEGLLDSIVVIFRVHKPIALCDKFSIEKLYGNKKIEAENISEPLLEAEPGLKRIGTLEINSRIWYFIDGVMDCITDGIKCRCWFELKIKEFLVLLRAYYTKEKLHDFFYIILSGDTAFSEYVRLNWLSLRTVQSLADSLNMTRKQFTTRFTRVFGKTPIRWMTETRAQMAYKEITSTKKPFKQIASECGFSSDTELIRFSKKEFKKTPTELRDQEGNREKL